MSSPRIREAVTLWSGVFTIRGLDPSKFSSAENRIHVGIASYIGDAKVVGNWCSLKLLTVASKGSIAVFHPLRHDLGRVTSDYASVFLRSSFAHYFPSEGRAVNKIPVWIKVTYFMYIYIYRNLI